MNINPSEVVPGFKPEEMPTKGSTSEWAKFLDSYPYGIDSFKILCVTQDPKLVEYFDAYNLCKVYCRLQDINFLGAVRSIFKKHTLAFKNIGAFIAKHGYPAVGYLKAQIKYSKIISPNKMYSEAAAQKWERYQRTELAKVVLSKDKEKVLRELSTLPERNYELEAKVQAGKRYFKWVRSLFPPSMSDSDVIWCECLSISPDYLLTRPEFTDVYQPGFHPLLDQRIDEAKKRAREARYS